MRRELILARVAIVGLPSALLAVAILIMQSRWLSGNDLLGVALTADLLVGIPLVYFLLISRTDIPKFTVFPVMILGAALGSAFLPTEHQTSLAAFKTWALPGIELCLLGLIVIKLRSALKRFKHIKVLKPDFFTALKHTCLDVLPRALAIPMATEIAVFYYGFFYWKRRRLAQDEFSYHRESGTPTLLTAFLIILLMETVIIHILLANWSLLVAWIMTILNLYAAIQLLGFVKSMFDRPAAIDGGKLRLRYGIMSEATVDLRDIESVELSTREIEPISAIRKLSIWGRLESHNVIIRLRKECTMQRLYGFERSFKVLLLHVDNSVEFKNRTDIARSASEL